jgi:predicted SAM-dependent methyltransferase
MKVLNLGCGKQYASDAWNIDIDGVLATECSSDLIKENLVTLDNYYPESFEVLTKLARGKSVIADEINDARFLYGYRCGTIDAIYAIQLFEHIAPPYTQLTLGRWYEILKQDGFLIMSVPDIIGTAQALLDTQLPDEIDFYIRHIYGSGRGRKGNYQHRWGYTKDSLSVMLFEAGFKRVDDYPNIHSYPAIMLKAVK